ncbi:hypothetical protein [Neptunicella sp. SCSIO 80796]|uniref:hypothetical protein n=1 Tax=Neptunicella plasticusilytica TaxID=3117012 RepID=UPI003A4E4FF8
MSVWTGIKSLFSSDNVIEKVSSGIDAVWYTDQEKAGNFQWLLKLYEPYKIAQRLLAVIFCVPYALAFLITFVASFFISVQAQMALLSGDIATIVGIVVAFYFGGGAVEGVIKKIKSRVDNG